jgi:hypothetical protein
LQIIFPNMGKSKIETENQNGLSWKYHETIIWDFYQIHTYFILITKNMLPPNDGHVEFPKSGNNGLFMKISHVILW